MKILLTNILLIPFLICKSQTLLHTDLSSNFTFQTSIKRIKTKNAFDSSLVKIKIYNKSNDSLVQTIRFTSTFLFEFSYSNKNSCRSYSTGKNKNSEITDNDFGDIVIADFNFDGKDDFAFKTEEGGNGGPLYSFYIQSDRLKFIKDPFLTNRVIFFPSKINSSNKTMTTIVHANAMGVNHNTYKLDTLTNKWKFIKTKFVRVK